MPHMRTSEHSLEASSSGSAMAGRRSACAGEKHDDRPPVLVVGSNPGDPALLTAQPGLLARGVTGELSMLVML
eukprot:scaffold70013_cov39-Prasinocladus_malaysianus.AAC.1